MSAVDPPVRHWQVLLGSSHGLADALRLDPEAWAGGIEQWRAPWMMPSTARELDAHGADLGEVFLFNRAINAHHWGARLGPVTVVGHPTPADALTALCEGLAAVATALEEAIEVCGFAICEWCEQRADVGRHGEGRCFCRVCGGAFPCECPATD
ncbi:MAG: hypothetical protein CVU56_16685 [Deltaproteobacteria bacterium HGW-Deltaproteobacteria-14]|jgi:hypothetical protein|nr:MAG: hypothetical protein CVU56_16685 [Deltaproteobacteria bacterium HGW-Deltaproteobacteria-14]